MLYQSTSRKRKAYHRHHHNEVRIGRHAAEHGNKSAVLNFSEESDFEICKSTVQQFKMSSTVVINAAPNIIEHHDKCVLRKYGGVIDMDKDWARPDVGLSSARRQKQLKSFPKILTL